MKRDVLLSNGLIFVLIFVTILSIYLTAEKGTIMDKAIITGAAIGLTAEAEPSPIWEILFYDSFNRNDASAVGNAWQETDDLISDDSDYSNEGQEEQQIPEAEEVEITTKSDIKIARQRLVFDSKNQKNKPLLRHNLTARTSGIINWSFTFNFARGENFDNDGSNNYELWLQLGNNATMADPEISDTAGVAVNLKWGGPGNGFNGQEGFGYLLNDNLTQIATLSGNNASLQIIASLDSHLFNITINGALLASNVAFDPSVTIDAIRIYVDKLNQNLFALRELDDWAISFTERNAPKITSLTAWPPIINVSSQWELAANIIDDSAVSSATAKIIYPNGTTDIIFLSPNLADPRRYNASLIIPNLQGAYQVTIIANDTFNNVNASNSVSFTVNSTDADQDGVADEIDFLRGNWKNVTVSGISNFYATIGGKVAEGTFNGLNEVLFYDGLTPVLNFTHNFSAGGMDFSQIKVLLDAQSIIVNLSSQLLAGESKTIYLTDNNFITLCVKDAEISAINELSEDCTGNNETVFTSCLGNSSSVTLQKITCQDQGSTIKIANLKHSGVKGVAASTDTGINNPIADDGSASGGRSSRNLAAGAQKIAAAEPAVEISSAQELTPPPSLLEVVDVSASSVSESALDAPAVPTGAVISDLSTEPLTPYILKSTMIVAIMIIVFVVVYFTDKLPGKIK